MTKVSLELVQTQYAQVAEEITLECGATLGPITMAYETYGQLNADKSNVILILHALSGDAHAAGYHEGAAKPGWWDILIGPGKAFDTNRYFVICSNALGGCKGTTGPSSINPQTGKTYGLSFPVITIADMVNVQKKLLDYLGIKQLLCVTGGSMGGMKALQWTVAYPEMVKSAVVIATNTHHTPQQIAFNEVGRQAIMADPAWRGGNYYEQDEKPHAGLAVARMVGHITYLSDTTMEQKFGRKLKGKEQYGFDFSTDFEVESYLRYQGDAFIKRFDANSYLYITKALDYFDLANGHGSLVKAFAGVKARFLIITFSSDWLYPPAQTRGMVRAMKANDIDVTYCEINSDYGHDAFLMEAEKQENIICPFLCHTKTPRNWGAKRERE